MSEAPVSDRHLNQRHHHRGPTNEAPAPPPYEPDADVIAYIEKGLEPDNVEQR